MSSATLIGREQIDDRERRLMAPNVCYMEHAQVLNSAGLAQPTAE